MTDQPRLVDELRSRLSRANGMDRIGLLMLARDAIDAIEAEATAAVPLNARESLRHQLRTFTDHSNGSIHVDEPGDVDAFLDAILQTGGWRPAAVPLDHGDHVPAWKWCYFGLTIAKAEAQGVSGHRFCEGCARLSADEEGERPEYIDPRAIGPGHP